MLDKQDWTALGGGPGPRYAVRGYVVGGESAVGAAVASGDYSGLRGSFLLRVADETGTTYVTDRTASVRAYLQQSSDGSTAVQDSPFPGASASAALDVGSIGSILVNGYALAGRTLFEGTTSLPAGSVVRVSGGRATTKAYWSFTPRPDKTLGRDEAKKALADAVLTAVDRHVTGPSRISLSAGYDARALLGVLRYRLGRTDVETFSYAHGVPAAGSDAALAAELAAAAGYPHQVVESVRGDLMLTIEDNARLGHGLTNFCDEVVVWSESLPRDLPVVVGDECFGWSGFDLKGADELLESVFLHRATGLRRLRSLGLTRYDELRTATDELVQEVVDGAGAGAGAGEGADPHDTKDALYFRERLCNGLMPWRAAFAGDGRQVINPLLDGDVLDVVAALPSADRISKRLYREMVHELIPEVFTTPMATSMGYSPNWRSLLVADSDRIRASLAKPSALDDLVPPEAIDRLAVRCATRRSSAHEVTQRVGSSLRARTPAMAAVGRRLDWEASDPTLLRRLLVVRAALAR